MSDLISAGELERSVQSVLMAPAQTELSNWTDAFEPRFVADAPSSSEMTDGAIDIKQSRGVSVAETI